MIFDAARYLYPSGVTGLTSHTAADVEDGISSCNATSLTSNPELLTEFDWGFELAPSGGLQVVRQAAMYEASSAAHASSTTCDASTMDGKDGGLDEQGNLWDG